MKLGEKQTLIIDRVKEFGVYLREPEDLRGADVPDAQAQMYDPAGKSVRRRSLKKDASDRGGGRRVPAPRRAEQSGVLLPKKEVPAGMKPGDEIEVFLYKDSDDRLIATTAEPKVTLHQIALLRVAQTAKIGAFLDWGLPKDLLLPFHEQTRRVKTGEEVLAALYIDKSDRLAATMNVYPYLSSASPYKKDSRVKARIYETSQNFGVFAAVDDRYSGLIPKQEAAGKFRIGDVVDARVTSVREDGRLNLSVREKAYLQIEKDAELIVKVIEEYSGVLPFDDKVSPEIIEREFGLSKNAFKRAVGHLLKEEKAEIRDRRIYLVIE